MRLPILREIPQQASRPYDDRAGSANAPADSQKAGFDAHLVKPVD